MLSSIGRYAPALIAGSAISGFGLAFGRDMYRKAKEKWPFILILLLLAGVFFSGMWLFRNYRTVNGRIFKRMGALIVLAVSVTGVSAVSMLLAAALRIRSGVDSGNFVDGDILHVLFNPPLLYIVIVQIGLFGMGPGWVRDTGTSGCWPGRRRIIITPSWNRMDSR